MLYVILSVIRFIALGTCCVLLWNMYRYFRRIPENDSMEPHWPYLKKRIYALIAIFLLISATYVPELALRIGTLIQEIGK